MAWYYMDGDQQKGPVSKADLQALIKSRQVGPQTLVKNVQMDDWVTLKDAARGKAKPSPSPSPPPPPPDDEPLNKMEVVQKPPEPDSAPTAVCSQCGRSFPQDQVISYDDQQICAACKPIFVQKLKEGAVLPTTMHYGGFWIRFVAKVIDGIILSIVQWAIMIPLGMFMAPAITQEAQQLNPDIYLLIGVQVALGFAIPMVYGTFFLGRFGATLGKMACRLKVVTPDGGKITYMRGFGRVCAELISYIILAIGYIMAAFDSEKRALHDRICSTRVVRRT